jgi:hypothetical protein
MIYAENTTTPSFLSTDKDSQVSKSLCNIADSQGRLNASAPQLFRDPHDGTTRGSAVFGHSRIGKYGMLSGA